MEIELPEGGHRVLELNDGDRVFLMNTAGNTIDGVIIGD